MNTFTEVLALNTTNNVLLVDNATTPRLRTNPAEVIIQNLGPNKILIGSAPLKADLVTAHKHIELAAGASITLSKVNVKLYVSCGTAQVAGAGTRVVVLA